MDIARCNEAQIARLGVGRKFQTPNVFKSLTVLANLRLSLKYPRGVFHTLMAPFKQDGKDRVHEILGIIGLTAKAHKEAGILSHGEKQWLELGMLMAQDPELLLVDEPVAGMTPRESERTGELLMAMSRKHTLLVIDHDMTFVRQIAGKVTVLHEGRLLSEGTIREVQDNPQVIEVYLGHHKVEKKHQAPAKTQVAEYVGASARFDRRFVRRQASIEARLAVSRAQASRENRQASFNDA